MVLKALLGPRLVLVEIIIVFGGSALTIISELGACCHRWLVMLVVMLLWH